MPVRRQVLLTSAAVLGLLLPFAGGAGASTSSATSCPLGTDSAFSSGPYSMGSTNGTVPGCTTRVSVPPANVGTTYDPNEDGTSQRPRISEDGNWVVFQSGANNLVSDYTAGHGTDDYIVNKSDPAGTIQMLDRNSAGGMPNMPKAGGGATFVDVSGDGHYAVFYSTATNLVLRTTTRSGSVFLRDTQLDQTIEVPMSYQGGETNQYSTRPTISATPDASGRYYITYNSKGTDLVAGDTNTDDVYVTAFTPGTGFSRANLSEPMVVGHPVNTGGSNGQNEHAEISSDGSHIAWQSTATNLPGYTGKSQVYEAANPFQHPTASAVLVSVSTSGGGSSGANSRPAIDGTGDVVAWESTATNLVSATTGGLLNVFLRNMNTGQTSLASVDYNGNPLTAASQRPSLDYAGDKVSFASNAHNVVQGDTNGQRDVFLRDLTTSTNYLIDVCQYGGFGGGSTSCPAGTTSATSSGSTATVVPYARAGGSDLSSRAFLSSDGLTVAFISGMSDLVPNDTNGTCSPTPCTAPSLDDIFVRQFTSN